MKQKEQKHPAVDEAGKFCLVMGQHVKSELRARELMEAAEAKLNAARKQRADEMVEALLATGNGEVPEPGPPSPEEVGLETARNALLAIRRRISDLDVQILVLREKLQAERQQYNEARVADFVTASQSIAEAWNTIRTRANGLAAALGVDASTILTRFPAPADWTNDPEARKTHEANCTPRKLSETLAGFAKDAESRVFLAESTRRQQVAHFNPMGKFVVARPIMFNGKALEVGTVLDRFSMDVAWLAKLHAARRLQQVPEELA